MKKVAASGIEHSSARSKRSKQERENKKSNRPNPPVPPADEDAVWGESSPDQVEQRLIGKPCSSSSTTIGPAGRAAIGGYDNGQLDSVDRRK